LPGDKVPGGPPGGVDDGSGIVDGVVAGASVVVTVELV
jgi:hypothetical protein